MRKEMVAGVLCSLLMCFTTLIGAACEGKSANNSSQSISTETELKSTSELPVDSTDITEVPLSTKAPEATTLEAEDFSIENRLEEGDISSINYPVFTSQTYSGYQDNFNSLLKQYACNYWTLPEEGIHYSVSYEITGYSPHYISILYSLRVDGIDNIQKHSLNLSLISGNEDCLMDNMGEGVDWNASYIWNGDAECEIISEGVSNIELSEYLQAEYPDYETFLYVFSNADNTDLIAAHNAFWTYISDEAIIVLIPVSDEMENYVEVKMVIGG